ncbi:MAG: (Fe-S)-binding protein [Clostridiales bacterium]|nr:(Fe-S)-binding protein [Clostridiales bacterium]
MDSAEYEKIIKACRFCLMCRHLCTVGNITYAETNTPRGQALALDCLGSEALEDTPGTRKRLAEVLFSCCYCGHCESNCVSSYRHPDAIMAARAMVREEDLPARVRALRGIVSKTGEFYEAPAQVGEPVMALAGGEADAAGNDVLLYIGSFARNEGKAMAAGAPRNDGGEAAGSPRNDGGEAAGSQAVAEAAAKALYNAGVGFAVLPCEGGTGMAAYLLGMPDEAQRALDREIGRIGELSPGRVVCLSPEDQRVLSGGVPGLDASALKAPVVGFAAFALELIRGGKLSPKPGHGGKPVVAWHDGDQGGRFLNDFEAPREVVKSIPGIGYSELFWSKGEAASAGESGAVHMLDEGLACEIAAKRLEQVEGRGIDILATDSPEAKARLSAAGGGLAVLHIAELLV